MYRARQQIEQLRVDAITAANTDRPAGGCPAGNGRDTLRLVVPVYTLTQVNNGGTDFYGDPNGLPVITSGIYLNGRPNGGDDPGVVIERSAALGTPPFRLLDIAPAGNLAVQAVTLRNGAAVSGNAAPEGGGIRNAGRLQLIGCTVTGGKSGSARPAAGVGGIYNGQTGVADLYSSVVTDNAGGIDNAGTLSLRESTVSSNIAAGVPYAPGIGLGNSGRVTMLNSTVSGNETGIRNSGVADVTNSTISGNSLGGFLNSGVATLNYVTLVWNKEGAFTFPEHRRGALVSTSTGKVTLSNSIVANSIGTDCKGSVGLPAVNLIGDGSCRAKAKGALTGDPKLGLLTNNGGLTLTHALLSGSPALDASDDTNRYPETDQRGVPRPEGTKRDLGAFEGVVTATIGDWQLVSGDQSYAGDLDGDHRDEIFVRNGRYAAVLGEARGQWTSQAVAGNWVGRKWRLGAGDRSYVGDFDGNVRAEVYVQNASHAPGYAGVLRYDGSRLVSESVVAGPLGQWRLTEDDQSYIGDFDHSGKDGVFARRAHSAGLLGYYSGLWGSETVVRGRIGDWRLSAGDRSMAGDFDVDGSAQVYVRNDDRAAVLSYRDGQMHSLVLVGGAAGN